MTAPDAARPGRQPGPGNLTCNQDNTSAPATQPRLTPRQAVRAKCKDCCCGYADGRVDCEIPSCPLYPWMPYGAGRPAKQRAVRSLSEAQAVALAAGRARRRLDK